MITPNAALSVNRQCTLLGIARSSFYYQPRPTSAAEFDLLNRLDRIFTEHPVYGSRRLQVALLREGISVGRRRIRRLMRKLGLEPISIGLERERGSGVVDIFPEMEMIDGAALFGRSA
jgi:putative transposase